MDPESTGNWQQGEVVLKGVYGWGTHPAGMVYGWEARSVFVTFSPLSFPFDKSIFSRISRKLKKNN